MPEPAGASAATAPVAAPDWPGLLARDETLLWSGRPDFTGMAMIALYAAPDGKVRQ